MAIPVKWVVSSVLSQIIQAFAKLDQFFADFFQTADDLRCLSGLLLIDLQTLFGSLQGISVLTVVFAESNPNSFLSIVV